MRRGSRLCKDGSATVTDREPYSADVTTDAADAAPDTQAPDDPTQQDAPDPTAPAPGDGSGIDATDDQGGTFNLSDEAAAALYPDVDEPDPPQIDPSATQVPPPFAQRPSPLLDIVRMYGSGQTDWPAARQALIAFDYAPLPDAAGAPTGPTAGQWYGDVEANAQAPAPPGSWPELQAAADHGMLTQDEFNQVLAARAGQNPDQQGDDQSSDSILAAAGDAGDSGPGDPTPTEGKAWSDAARAAAYKARMEHLRNRLGDVASEDVITAHHGAVLDPVAHDAVLQGHGVLPDGSARVSDDEIVKHLDSDHRRVIRMGKMGSGKRWAEDPATVHAQQHGADTTPAQGQAITDTIRAELERQGIHGRWWGDKSNGLQSVGAQGETGYSVHDHGPYLRIHVPTSQHADVKWRRSGWGVGDEPEEEFEPTNPEAAHKDVAAAVEKATGAKPSVISLAGYSTQGERQVSYTAIVPKRPPADQVKADEAAQARGTKLPRSRSATKPIGNGTRVIHEDGRTGVVQHIPVSELRPGDELVNPVSGKASGKVKDVRWGRAFDKPVDNRTPLGADRKVTIEGGDSHVMGMGARYTRFVPDDPGLPKPTHTDAMDTPGRTPPRTAAEAMGRVHDRLRVFAGQVGNRYSTQPAFDRAAHALLSVRTGMEQGNPPSGVRAAWEQAQEHFDALHDELGKDKMAHGPEPSYSSEAEAELAARGVRKGRQATLAKIRKDVEALVDHYAPQRGD